MRVITKNFEHVHTFKKINTSYAPDSSRIFAISVSKKSSMLSFQWPLFTYTLALLKMDPVKNEDEILTNLKKLAEEIDPQRRGMYEEIMSNLRVDARLREKLGNKTLIERLIANGDSLPRGTLTLANCHLTRYHFSLWWAAEKES